MDTVAVLPIKTFSRAKHRLSEAVEPPGRRELAEAMVGDVLAALAAVGALARVIAVTAEPRAADAARAGRRRGRARSARGRPVGRRGARASRRRCELGAGAGAARPRRLPGARPGEVTALLAQRRPAS